MNQSGLKATKEKTMTATNSNHLPIGSSAMLASINALRLVRLQCGNRCYSAL
jgi:hypothetical protein